jgi:hypothetical protein
MTALFKTVFVQYVAVAIIANLWITFLHGTYIHAILKIGSGSYNGRRAVSETDNEGPIPSPEAYYY